MDDVLVERNEILATRKGIGKAGISTIAQRNLMILETLEVDVFQELYDRIFLPSDEIIFHEGSVLAHYFTDLSEDLWKKFPILVVEAITATAVPDPTTYREGLGWV